MSRHCQELGVGGNHYSTPCSARMNKIWILNGHGSAEVRLRLELCLLVLAGAVTGASEAARTGIFGCLCGSQGQPWPGTQASRRQRFRALGQQYLRFFSNCDLHRGGQRRELLTLGMQKALTFRGLWQEPLWFGTGLTKTKRGNQKNNKIM